jgi:hypothetical protein
MQVTATRPRVLVSATGTGVVSHAGSRLLAELADRSGLTSELSGVFSADLAPQTAHDPGRVLTDLAVMIADGGEAISDIATLGDQAALFGPVASDSTCWRVLDSLIPAQIAGVAGARARARALVWAQRAEVTGASLPASGSPTASSWTRLGGQCWSLTSTRPS